jgi:hypothetical protein
LAKVWPALLSPSVIRTMLWKRSSVGAKLSYALIRLSYTAVCPVATRPSVAARISSRDGCGSVSETVKVCGCPGRSLNGSSTTSSRLRNRQYFVDRVSFTPVRSDSAFFSDASRSPSIEPETSST